MRNNTGLHTRHLRRPGAIGQDNGTNRRDPAPGGSRTHRNPRGQTFARLSSRLEDCRLSAPGTRSGKTVVRILPVMVPARTGERLSTGARDIRTLRSVIRPPEPKPQKVPELLLRAMEVVFVDNGSDWDSADRLVDAVGGSLSRHRETLSAWLFVERDMRAQSRMRPLVRRIGTLSRGGGFAGRRVWVAR